MPDLSDEDELDQTFEHEHVDGALILSWGPVHVGREALAVETFVNISRYFGRLLAEEVISSFKPLFYADGQQGDVSGFFLLEGHREQLDALRRGEEWTRQVLAAGSAVQNVRVHTMVAGSEAGRLVNLYREVRQELGLI